MRAGSERERHYFMFKYFDLLDQHEITPQPLRFLLKGLEDRMDPVALSDFLSMVKALTGAHPSATSAPGPGSPPGHIRAGTGDWRDAWLPAHRCASCARTPSSRTGTVRS